MSPVTSPVRSSRLWWTHRRRSPATLAVLGGKWKILILWQLLRRPCRFGELRRAIKGVSQHMLTVHLRELEGEGILTRTVFAEVPPRVEYALTPHGATLNGVIRALAQMGRIPYEEGEHLFWLTMITLGSFATKTHRSTLLERMARLMKRAAQVKDPFYPRRRPARRSPAGAGHPGAARSHNEAHGLRAGPEAKGHVPPIDLSGGGK